MAEMMNFIVNTGKIRLATASHDPHAAEKAVAVFERCPDWIPVACPSGDFRAAMAYRAELMSDLEMRNQEIRAIPGISSGPMGLTPDHVKAGSAYREASYFYEIARGRLARFNQVFTKAYRKEFRAAREEHRAWSAGA